MPVNLEPLAVLVVDDSALTREALRRTLELEPRLRVVGEARTGEEAVALARTLAPRLVTMDLNMPGMGGLKAIEAIMAERPTPIVVISERSSTGQVDLNYEALSRGALELVPKSAVFGAGDGDVRRFVERLRDLALAGLDEERLPVAAPAPTIPVSQEVPLLLGIGASTGGPKALAKVLSSLPRDFSLPVAVVQHMADDFFDSFVRYLRDASRHAVVAASAGVTMEPGRVYVAPPRHELFVREDLSVKLLPPPSGALISPSVDSLFFSMANALKGRGIGVLLTGMGEDGAQGLLRMRRMGARTVVQDRESCAVFGMPRAAYELGAAERLLPLDAIGPYLVATARAPVAPPAPAPAPKRGEPTLPAASPARRKVLLVAEAASAFAPAQAALERGGFEVFTLDNPMMLARTIRRSSVDVVLLDPELETIKAAVVVQTLRTHGVQVPVCLWAALPVKVLDERVRECRAEAGVTRGDDATLLRTVTRLARG